MSQTNDSLKEPNTDNPKEVVAFITGSLEHIGGQRDKIASLEGENKKLTEQVQDLNGRVEALDAEKQDLAKQASENMAPVAFSDERVEQTLDLLTSLNYVTGDKRATVKEAFQKDPDSVLDLIVKLAGNDPIGEATARDPRVFGETSGSKPSDGYESWRKILK